MNDKNKDSAYNPTHIPDQPEYRHPSPLPAEENADSVTGIHEQTGADFEHARVADAIVRTPLGLQEFIGKRTEGNSRLFEDVLVRCRGSEDFARLLLDQYRLEQQIGDPKYDQVRVKSELKNITGKIKEIEESIES